MPLVPTGHFISGAAFAPLPSTLSACSHILLSLQLNRERTNACLKACQLPATFFYPLEAAELWTTLTSVNLLKSKNYSKSNPLFLWMKKDANSLKFLFEVKKKSIMKLSACRRSYFCMSTQSKTKTRSQVCSPFHKQYNQVLLISIALNALFQQPNFLPSANGVGQLSTFPFFTFSKNL